MPFQFQTPEQRRNAVQSVQADAPMNQPGNLRGQQNTSPLGMPQDVGSRAMQTAITRSAMGIDKGATETDNPGKAIFDQEFGAFRKEQQLKRMMDRLGVPYTPLQQPIEQVTPAERARESEAQRMAQQYGGNEMRLALMDRAPTDQRLVDYYGAQARGAQSLSGEMAKYFTETGRFENEAQANQFITQHAGVAFREYIKANPQAVIGEGQKAAFSAIAPEAIQDTMDQGGLAREDAIRQIQQGTAALMGEAQGTDRLQSNEAQMDGTIDLEGGTRNRELNQANAFVPLREASNNQALKTDEGVGVQGMQPQSAAIAAENMGQLSASPFYSANKEEFNRLGITSAVDPGLLDSLATQRLRQQLASIKGNKGFSYDA